MVPPDRVPVPDLGTLAAEILSVLTVPARLLTVSFLLISVL